MEEATAAALFLFASSLYAGFALKTLEKEEEEEEKFGKEVLDEEGKPSSWRLLGCGRSLIVGPRFNPNATLQYDRHMLHLSGLDDQSDLTL